MEKFIKNADSFKQNVHPNYANIFDQLRDGQSPLALFITCSDSRIVPSLVTGADPGELFVIRNAGNAVMSGNAGASGEAATIDYAVSVLGIRHIVVCGHSCCGAMNALQADPMNCEAPLIRDWLLAIQEGFKSHGMDIHPSDLDELIEKNVLVQLANLRQHPSVANALANGDVTLHGWVYRFETGDVLACDSEGIFAPIGQALSRQ